MSTSNSYVLRIWCVGHPDCPGHDRPNAMIRPCQCCVPEVSGRNSLPEVSDAPPIYQQDELPLEWPDWPDYCPVCKGRCLK